MSTNKMKAISLDLLKGQEVVRIQQEWCRVTSTEQCTEVGGRISVTVNFTGPDGAARCMTDTSDRLLAFRLDMQTVAVRARLSNLESW